MVSHQTLSSPRAAGEVAGLSAAKTRRRGIGHTAPPGQLACPGNLRLAIE
jgi:hypothetical protein